MAEHAIEAVEVAFVLDQCGARQVIEVLGAVAGQPPVESRHERQVLVQRDRYSGGLQFGEEGQEHERIKSIPWFSFGLDLAVHGNQFAHQAAERLLGGGFLRDGTAHVARRQTDAGGKNAVDRALAETRRQAAE